MLNPILYLLGGMVCTPPSHIFPVTRPPPHRPEVLLCRDIGVRGRGVTIMESNEEITVGADCVYVLLADRRILLLTQAEPDCGYTYAQC